jgi:hypothetical protein
MIAVWNIKGGSRMGMWKTIGERLGRPSRHCQLRWVKCLEKKEEEEMRKMKQKEETSSAGDGGGGAGATL